MPNQVLDAPFENELPLFLEKGETILWKGQSQKSYLPSKKDTPSSKNISIDGIPLVIFSFCILLAIICFGYIGLTNFSIVLSILLIWMNLPFVIYFFTKKRSGQIAYLITQKRLIIYLLKNKKIPIHIIDLNSISNISISKSEELGTITFQVQNQPTTDVVFRKFTNGKSETFASLENIEQSDEVSKLLTLAARTNPSDLRG